MIDDKIDDPDRIRRVLFCTGKLLLRIFWKSAPGMSVKDVAIVRVEQMYPFPVDPLREVMVRHHRENPRNGSGYKKNR